MRLQHPDTFCKLPVLLGGETSGNAKKIPVKYFGIFIQSPTCLCLLYTRGTFPPDFCLVYLCRPVNDQNTLTDQPFLTASGGSSSSFAFSSQGSVDGRQYPRLCNYCIYVCLSLFKYTMSRQNREVYYEF